MKIAILESIPFSAKQKERLTNLGKGDAGRCARNTGRLTVFAVVFAVVNSGLTGAGDYQDASFQGLPETIAARAFRPTKWPQG